MKSKIRPLGDVLLDMEVLLDEMCIKHGLQKGDILALVDKHLDIHNPDSVECYLDGTSPVFYYGPQEGLVRYGKRKKN